MKKNTEVVFYQRENGKVPVREFLFSLPAKLRAKAFRTWKIISGGIRMSKASVSFETIKNELMKDEEFKSEYERLKPRYEIISQIINARKEQNMTQEELAKKVGTQKSNISRLESGNYNPSLDFLIKVARSLGKELSIHMQ